MGKEGPLQMHPVGPVMAMAQPAARTQLAPKVPGRGGELPLLFLASQVV